MTLEDFIADYTEVDDDGTMTVLQNSIAWVNTHIRDNLYNQRVFRDFGAAYFDGDFTCNFKVNFTSATSGKTVYGAIWALGNVVNDMTVLDLGDNLAVLAVKSSIDLWTLQLRIVENGVLRLDASATLSAGTDYYLAIIRDDDGGANGTGQMTVRICTVNYYGKAGAVLVDTLTLDCAAGEKNDFRYLYATNDYDAGASTVMTLTISDLSVNVTSTLYPIGGFIVPEPLADMLEAKEQFGFEECGGLLYAVCGIGPTASDHSKKVHAYDPVSDSWAEKTDAPIALQSPILRAVNGKLYLIGGYDSSTGTFCNKCYEYNPSLDSWTEKAPMPHSLEDMGSAVIDDEIWVFGGIYQSFPSHLINPYINVYNPATNQWRVPSISWATPRCLGDFCCSYDGKVYVVSSTDIMSGYSGNLKASTNVFRYDTILNTFTEVAPCVTAVCYKEVEEIDGLLYVISGVSQLTTYIGTDQVYDVALNMWKARQNLAYAARGVGVAKLDGSIYFCGGFNGSEQAYLYRMTPSGLGTSGGSGMITAATPPTSPARYSAFNRQLDQDRV